MLVTSHHRWLLHAVDTTAIAGHLEQWMHGYTKSTLSFSTSLPGLTFVHFLAVNHPVKMKWLWQLLRSQCRLRFWPAQDQNPRMSESPAKEKVVSA